jgi:hypothetical protein
MLLLDATAISIYNCGGAYSKQKKNAKPALVPKDTNLRKNKSGYFYYTHLKSKDTNQ